MQQHNGVSTILGMDRYALPRFRSEEEVKTSSEVSTNKQLKKNIDFEDDKFLSKAVLDKLTHYLTLLLLALVVWSLLWSTWGAGWAWGGPWFRVVAVPLAGWAAGEALHELTTLPPLLAALLTGILARNLGILDMRQHLYIDGLLRKVYPVGILGKASLGWNLGFMTSNWRQVAPLGILPWTAEVTTLAICTHYFLDFPWLWGFLLGTIYSSVSCPVIMMPVVKHAQGCSRNWVQLVCTAGGLDTGLSVGVYGTIFSFIFINANQSYKYVKAALTLFAGCALGTIWGSIAKFVPSPADTYVSELRVLFVFLGGLAGNVLTGQVGWLGTGVIAVLACNATAAHHWAKTGWKINDNPASRAYRAIWSTLEPIVFTYTGTFFVMDGTMTETMLLGFAILLICLTVRLTVTFFSCWSIPVRERLFICCAWSPKSIVEAVLSPMALSMVLTRDGFSDLERQTAERHVQLIVQAILITTPIGYLLTNHLGPKLLEKDKTIVNR